MDMQRYLAIDLGAESGRAVVGTLADGKLALDEIHRFPNGPVPVRGTLHWDILGIYKNILDALNIYTQRFGESVEGIGVDSWALDFGLLDQYGSLLQNPICYRDKRTQGMDEEVLARLPERDLFDHTGLPVVPIYTLYQLLSLQLNQPALLGSASSLLLIPDLLAHFLGGGKRCERTIAITTQLYDPRAGDWSGSLFDVFDLPKALMPELCDPGTVLGELDDSVKEATGLRKGWVVAPCSHDTGSAVSAAPGRGDDWAFISSGTWSVLGVMIDEAITSDAAFEAKVCNELAAGGLFVCRNIMGLWLLQQARAAWIRQGESYSYPDLVQLAVEAPAGGPLLNVDDASFLAPPDMTRAMAEYCRQTGQTPPASAGTTARCILESLALTYRHGLEQLRGMANRPLNVIHVVGGGSQNAALCQLTADATGLPVVAGPKPATAAGNLLVQAMARGAVSSHEEIREVVRRSTDLVEYEPKNTAYFDDRYGDYLGLLSPHT